MKRYSDLGGLVLATCGILFCPSIGAQEVSVGWHDRMYLIPGDGVRLNQQQEPVFPGLVIMSPTGRTTGNTGNTTTTAAFGRSTCDMIRSLNANSSVSLNLLASGGDVNFSFFGRQTFDANDLRFVVTTTRDFGTTKFPPVDLSSNFWNQVGAYQKGLQGADLYSAITSAFGTHYVAGYQSRAMVSVIYSFHFASAAAKQQAYLSASAGVGPFADLQTSVSTVFADTNTTTTLSYQFYSTDPFLVATNFGLVSAGAITNLQQFSLFTSSVQNYASSMSPTNARIAGYVLDPLWFAPGMLPLLGGYVPSQGNPVDYDGFFQAFSELQAWKQSIDPWILDGNALSWLNSNGRQLVQASWFHAVSYLDAMKTAAVNHFTTGAALTVPSDAAAFLSQLSYITLPKIYVMDNFVYSNDRYIIGRVDCGCRDLTISIPFNNISELQSQTNNGTLAPIYYNPVDFQNSQLQQYPTGNATTVHGHLTNLLASARWACLTNQVTNPNLNGLFLVTQPTSKIATWSIAISGGTGVNGNPIIVDQLGFFDTTSGSCPGSCLVTITNALSGSGQ